MALFKYLQDTQRWLREQNQVFENPNDLIAYVNRARKLIALQTQCIRAVTASSGVINGYSISAPGAGYTNPTVAVSAPDFPSGQLPNPTGLQATANATVLGGQIAQIDPLVGGAGYFQPTVTITDPTGTGAMATANVVGINLLNQGQEAYKFSNIDLSGLPGCGAVFAIRGVSLIYSGYRYSLEYMPWSRYQLYRAYPYSYQYTPAMYSQLTQGTSGEIFVYPLPSQNLQAEFDVQILPIDLVDDLSVEAIPDPWGEVVAYAACQYAMQELGNMNAARYYMDLYGKNLLLYSQATRIGRPANPYGRP